MKNKDLIAALQQYDPEIDVAILDWRLNLLSDLGDGSGDGIYTEPRLEVIKDEEERPGIPEEERKNASWLAILIDNPNLEDAFEEPRHCRVCGCTDDNCMQCILKTGQPCHWVEGDLCSACVESDGQSFKQPIQIQ